MSAHRWPQTLWCALIALALVGVAAWTMEGLLLRPRRAVVPPPNDLVLEDVTLSSAAHVSLKGWFLAGTPGRGAVVLLHGVRSNRLAMLPRARWLHSLGYAVLLIDFRASGESEGDQITLGDLESFDARAAVDYLRARLPRERIGVIGTSMGGAASLLAEPPLPVQALVLEQVYPNIDLAVQDRLQLHPGGATWLTPLLLTSMAWRTGIEPARLRPMDHIAGITAPKLLVVGSADQHTPLSESLAMYRHAAPPKELWVINGAQHVDLYRFDPPNYRARVSAFLEKHLTSAPFDAQSSKAIQPLRSHQDRGALALRDCGHLGSAP